MISVMKGSHYVLSSDQHFIAVGKKRMKDTFKSMKNALYLLHCGHGMQKALIGLKWHHIVKKSSPHP